MQDMSAFFTVKADGTATEIHAIGNGALWALYTTNRDAYENVWNTWRTLRRKTFHALPEEKGKPVPGTGVRRSRGKWTHNGAGVSANSRILSHHYADEGETGKAHRREIRRKERALWLSEWEREQMEEESAYDTETVAQWFYDTTQDMDSDVIPSVYTVGETVVEWPSDYYDEYGYSDYSCGDPFCDICGYSYDSYEWEDDDYWR